MKKESLVFGITGLTAGLVIGFFFANSINQTGVTSASGTTSASAPVSGVPVASDATIPAGHPDIGQVPGGSAGKMDVAVQETIDAAKAAPGDFDAQLKAADVYYRISRFDEALTYLNAAIKLKPEHRETMVSLGNTYFDAEKWEDAEKWYTAALAKKADDASVRTDLGLIYVFRSPPDYDRAIQEFNRSLAIDPNHIQTLQNLTVAYSKKTDTVKATETLAKLETVDPKNAAITQLRDGIKEIEKK